MFLSFLCKQIKSSWSSSSVVCAQIKVGVTKRISPSCPCAAGRGISCGVMTDLWSSPTCCRALLNSRSCCRTAVVRRSSPSHFAQRLCTCIPSAGGFTIPVQSAQVGLAWLGRLLPSSSAPSLSMCRSVTRQDGLHTLCGEDRSTD